MYTIKQAANKLGISPVTVRRYIKSGKLKGKLVSNEYRIAEDDVEALLTATAPTDVEVLMSRALETNDAFRYEHQRSEAFRRAETILRERGDTARADEVARDALIFGYRLVVQASAEKNETSNRGRFSPRMTGRDADGKPAAWPDPAWVGPDVVEHAKTRATMVQNPVTKAIYCDLVYEFSENADRPLYGRRAAETYLLAADVEPADAATFRYFNTQGHVLRAMELSLALKDDELFRQATQVALRKMEEFAKGGQPRVLLELIKSLLQQAKKLDATGIACIEALIEEASRQYFAAGNEHLGRSFVGLQFLLPAVKSDPSKQKQVRRELFDSFMREGTAKSASGMVAAYFYSEALKIAGGVISPEEQAALRHRIEDANLQSAREMQRHSFGFTVTDDDIQKYVGAVLRDDLEESLVRIALLPGMIPSVARAEKQAQEMLSKFPISQMLGSHSLQDGRMVAITPGGVELTEDHVMSRLSLDVQMHGIWLGFLFDELKRRGLDAQTLAAYLSQKDFFPNEAMPAISEALADYFDGRYYSTIAVLLTQLEQILRLANRKLDMPTLKSLQSGQQRVIYLQEALGNLKAVLDAMSPDIYPYFSLVLIDKRGLGLRDTTAHGLLEFGGANAHQANLLLHLLLILAVFEYKTNAVGNSAATGEPTAPSHDNQPGLAAEAEDHP